MSGYMKINTLWMREENGKKKGKIIPGQFACPEFEAINRWHVTEKVDGTNMRVQFSRHDYYRPILNYFGKTDDAVFYPGVKECLDRYLSKELLDSKFPDARSVTIYGEAFGGKINGGNKTYGDDVDFIVFDIEIDGWWLEPKNAEAVAHTLGLGYVPIISEKMTTEEIIEFVKSEPTSAFSTSERKFAMEGVVCRSTPQMLFRRNKEPIVFKLKCRDYRQLKA